MPFAHNRLQLVHSHGRDQSVWFYVSDDNVATTVASGYFNAVAGKLRQHDLVLISATDGAGIRRVSSATGATPVTLAAGS